MNSLLKLNCRHICHSSSKHIRAFACHQRRFLSTSDQNNKSHYATLELSLGATQSDIKTAYYKLSMKFHPDKNKGNEDKFKEISTAYEVLGNPRLRRLYDRGIISHDHASIHQHTDPEESGTVAEQSENAKASVRTFDQWSRNHYSETFTRSQGEKNNRAKLAKMKKLSSERTGSENMVWLLGAICCVLAFLTLQSPWDKSKKKS